MSTIRKYVIGVFAACSLLCAWKASAGAAVALSSRELHYTAQPGDKITGSITVYNHGKADRTLKAYMEDFMYAEPFTGAKDFLAAGVTEHSLSNWVLLGLREFIVPAGGEQEIPFTIQVPAETSEGGYYAILIFEEDARPMKGNKAIGVVQRSGCAVFVDTPGVVPQAALKDIRVDNAEVSGTLRNTGKNVVVTEGSFFVVDTDGVPHDRGMFPRIYLPAGEKTAFSASLRDELPPGEYTLVLTFGLGAGEVLVKEIGFSAQ